MEIGNNRLVFVCLSTLLVCFISTSAFVIKKRSIHMDDEMPGILNGVVPRSNDHGQELCHISDTCAWEVYRPFKRTFEYLIKNTCECPHDYMCVKSGEDLSISAYIYKCQPAEAVLAAFDDHHHRQVSLSEKSI